MPEMSNVSNVGLAYCSSLQPHVVAIDTVCTAAVLTVPSHTPPGFRVWERGGRVHPSVVNSRTSRMLEGQVGRWAGEGCVEGCVGTF